MIRSRLIWSRKVSDVLLRTGFFLMMGYGAWTALQTPHQHWAMLTILWIMVISSVVTPTFMIYQFVKTTFSTPSDPNNPR